MNAAEIAAHDAIQLEATKSLIVPLPVQAQAALDFSDKVAWRCLKSGVPYPATWLAVDVANRAILNGSDKISAAIVPFPKKVDGSVDYPAGT